MKRKPYLTTGALFMGLIVILGAIGIVNGLWSKNLTVQGTVETGDLNADWDCGWVNDDALDGTAGVVGTNCAEGTAENTGDNGLDPDNFDWPNFNNTEHPLKDVGECDLVIDPDTEEFGAQVAEVTIINAYPSYECTITLFLTNTGSIPFNLISAELIFPTGQAAVLETVDSGGTNRCDLTIGEDAQVDPGEERQFDCTVHVAQIAEQSTCTGATTNPDIPAVENENCGTTPTTYQFAIDVCVAQWNEDATAEQCKTSSEHEGPPESFPPED